MDAISKELEAWNLTFIKVLARLINLMLRKYFSVLVQAHIVNVICKFLNVEKDKPTTHTIILNVHCCTPTCCNSNLVSRSNLMSPIKFVWANYIMIKLDSMAYPFKKQSLQLLVIIIFITWQNILVNHSQREAEGIPMVMPKLK